MSSATAMPVQYQQPPAFHMTADQKKLRGLLSAEYTRVLAHGGSRSGKTFELIRAICVRACKAPGIQTSDHPIPFPGCEDRYFHGYPPESVETMLP